MRWITRVRRPVRLARASPVAKKKVTLGRVPNTFVIGVSDSSNKVTWAKSPSSLWYLDSQVSFQQIPFLCAGGLGGGFHVTNRGPRAEVATVISTEEDWLT